MVSAGEVAARQTLTRAVTVVSSAVTLARPTVGVAVEATLTLVALTTVGVGHTRALAGLQVTERVT